MNKLTLLSISTAALITLSGQAFSEYVAVCELPGAPIIPDGNVASEYELVTAQKAMTAFQGSLSSFRDCIKKEEMVIDEESVEAPAQAQALLEQYNNSIDAEEDLAAKFNSAVKAFKARSSR